MLFLQYTQINALTIVTCFHIFTEEYFCSTQITMLSIPHKTKVNA